MKELDPELYSQVAAVFFVIYHFCALNVTLSICSFVIFAPL